MMDQSKNTNMIVGILVVIIIGLVVVLYSMQPKSPLTETSVTATSTETATDTAKGASAPTAKTNTSGGTETTSSSGTGASETTVSAPVTSTPGSTMVVVTYTDSGFVPPVVEVKQGEGVTFINSSSKPMWVTSEYHPTAQAQYYPEFNQSKSVGSGGTFTFSFTKVGVWGYKNLNYPSHLGAVSVVAQKQ